MLTVKVSERIRSNGAAPIQMFDKQEKKKMSKNSFNQNVSLSASLGNSGGPGNAGETGTGATGGEGMMPETATYSGTGGTGASGLGGGVGKAVSSILDMDESIEDFAKKVASAGLYGATGGEGQHGPLEDATKDDVSLSNLAKKFSDQLNKEDNSEVILQGFIECQTPFDKVQTKANSMIAYFAFMQGKRLLRLQGIRSQQNNHDWINWIKGKLPNLKKRSREKYMSMAGLPGVENHLEYGVERLADFGTLYSKTSDEEKAKLGSDPFKEYMREFDIDLDDSSDEERKLNADAVLEVIKLKRIGVTFPKNEMVSFLSAEPKLTSEERKHLKNLYEEDPQKPIDLLMLIVAKKLERKNLIAGTDTPPLAKEKGGNDKDGSSNAAVKEPNIDRLVATLCVSLKPVASKGVGADNAIDRASLLELKGYIDALLAVSETPVEAAE